VGAEKRSVGEAGRWREKSWAAAVGFYSCPEASARGPSPLTVLNTSLSSPLLSSCHPYDKDNLGREILRLRNIFLVLDSVESRRQIILTIIILSHPIQNFTFILIETGQMHRDVSTRCATPASSAGGHLFSLHNLSPVLPKANAWSNSQSQNSPEMRANVWLGLVAQQLFTDFTAYSVSSAFE
jgi:hypothetical protein